MEEDSEHYYGDTTAYYGEQELQEDSVLLTLVQGYNWPGTLHRIATHPSETEDIGMQGRTALHVACDHDAPPIVIKALLQAYPEASTMVGTSNMNPLHITCSSQHASVDVVRVLLQEGGILPATMRDVDGDTPLHAACRCGAPIEVLDELIRANPLAVDERDYEGLTPLLRLWVRYFVILGNNFIDDVRSPADINGELAEAWNKTDLLLQASHRGSIRYYHGKLENGSLTSHRRLMYRSVHAASAVDCPRPVVKIATIIHPNQLTERDENGLLPIMIAASAPVYKVHDLSDEGYQLEDRIHGDEVSEEDHNDTEQNDLSSSSNNCTSQQPSVLEILLEAAPEAAKVKDPSGRLPLHRAIASGKTWSSGVKTLVDAYPEGVMTKDRKTNLYPFKLAASDGTSDCTTIYELLHSNPSLVVGGIHSSYASSIKMLDEEENNLLAKLEQEEDNDKKPGAITKECKKNDDDTGENSDDRKPRAKRKPEEVNPKN